MPEKEVFHNIGNLIFYSRWNDWLPVIKAHNFNKFKVKNTKPDIELRFHFIKELDFEAPPSQEEIDHLQQFAHLTKKPDSPMLRLKNIRHRMYEYIQPEANIDFFVAWNLVVLRDFNQKRMDVFFTREFGGYLEEEGCYLPHHHVTANFPHLFFSFMPMFSAFLFHASGLVIKDRAALFFAPDEGGKTTVLMNSHGEAILSEDQVMLRLEGKDAHAYSTPLGGLNSGPCRAKIGAFFLLEKHKRFEIIPIKPIELLKYLCQEHSNYTYWLPKRLRGAAFHVLSEISQSAPSYIMRFPKNHIDWDIIAKAIAHETSSL